MPLITDNSARSAQLGAAAPEKETENTVNGGRYGGLEIAVTTPREAVAYARKHVQGLIQGSRPAAPTTIAFGRSMPLHMAKATSTTPSSVGPKPAAKKMTKAVSANHGEKTAKSANARRKGQVKTPEEVIANAKKHLQGDIVGNPEKRRAPTTIAFGRSVPPRSAEDTSMTRSSVERRSATSLLGSAQRDILGNRGAKPVTLPADFKQAELPRPANVRRQPAVVAKNAATAPSIKKQTATSPLSTGQRKPNPRWVG